MLSRTLVFVPEDNFAKIRGILSLNGDDLVNGKLRLYNMYDKNIVFAIQIGDKKVLFDNIATNEEYCFNIVANINCDIVAVIAKFEGGNFIKIAEAKSVNKEIDYTELFTSNNDEIEETINNEIIKNIVLPDSTMQLNNVHSTTINKEFEIDIEEKNTNSKTNEISNFYGMIAEQIDDIFSRYPPCVDLEKNVQNTKWVKVNYADDDNYYVLGKLYEDGVVSHICYGLPSFSRNSQPPESLVKYCQWLPQSLDDIDGSGYWVMYQRADNGENVRL